MCSRLRLSVTTCRWSAVVWPQESRSLSGQPAVRRSILPTYPRCANGCLPARQDRKSYPVYARLLLGLAGTSVDALGDFLPDGLVDGLGGGDVLLHLAGALGADGDAADLGVA